MSTPRRLARQVKSQSRHLLQMRSISNNSRSIETPLQPSQVKYEYIDPDEVERLDYYVPGGYHPVEIGDKFHNDRYEVVHKLGFGRSSTTWLAQDRQNSRLVALKISTAESAKRTVHESQVLSRLAQAGAKRPRLPGQASVQRLLDSFPFSGPNGRHRCLVMDLARCSVDEAKEAAYHRLLHLPASRVIAA